MNFLMSGVRPMRLLGGVRGAHWNKDWKPAKVVTSEDQKPKAAAKYGLLPEEYKSYPDDGFGIGDYPDLPVESVESRDLFYPWDFPEYRRDFGEPIHYDANYHGEDRYDVCMKPRYSLGTMALAFLGVMGSTVLLYHLSKDWSLLPVGPKQLPYKQGVVHYKY